MVYAIKNEKIAMYQIMVNNVEYGPITSLVCASNPYSLYVLDGTDRRRRYPGGQLRSIDLTTSVVSESLVKTTTMRFLAMCVEEDGTLLIVTSTYTDNSTAYHVSRYDIRSHILGRSLLIDDESGLEVSEMCSVMYISGYIIATVSVWNCDSRATGREIWLINASTGVLKRIEGCASYLWATAITILPDDRSLVVVDMYPSDIRPAIEHVPLPDYLFCRRARAEEAAAVVAAAAAKKQATDTILPTATAP